MVLWLAAFLALPATALAAPLSGAWLIDARIGPTFSYSLVCVLKSQQQDLWGPCATVQEKSKSTTGYVTGNNVTFRYRTDYEGSGVKLTYHGAMQPDGSMKGKVNSTGTAEGVFEATRLTDVAAGEPVTWKVSVAFSEALRYVLLCTFKADGKDFAGPCVMTAGDTLKTEGKSDGSKVAFHYDTVFQGQPVHVAYAGAVQADNAIAGTISTGSSTGRFSAIRQ